MNTDIIENNISELFGLDGMAKEEKDAFLEEVGELIFDSALTRLMAEMNPTEKKEFETFISVIASDDNMMKLIEDKYPHAIKLIEEEIVKFKTEAINVLGNEKTN